MITLDGTQYDCDISFRRGVNLKELYRVQTKDGLQHRKLSTKKHVATIGFDSKDKNQYDALFDKLSEQTEYHTLIVPWGKSGTKTMQCMITAVADTWIYKDSEGNAYEGLEITFEER